MLFGRYVWSSKIYVVFWYMFSGILFLFILGKRHMETNVVKMCKRYVRCVNDMKRRGQKEHSNLYLNNTYNENT